MGKTANGAVWLDPNKASPFDFYQYWRNVEDADVMKCIRMLTFIPIEEIEQMEHWDDSRINEKKEILAFELTRLVLQILLERDFGFGGHVRLGNVLDDAHFANTLRDL